MSAADEKSSYEVKFDDHGILHSQFANVNIPEDKSLPEFCFADIDKFKDRPFLVDSISGASVSFADMKQKSRQLGAGLAKKGFKKGDTFAIYCPNMIHYGYIFHGVVGIGGILTTCNPLYTETELEHQLVDSKAKYLVTISMFLDKALAAQKLAKEAGQNVEEVFVLGAAEKGATAFSTLLDNDGTACPVVKINPKEDPAVLPYSSGTTGLPKGVVLTHYNIISNLCQMDHKGFVDLSDKDVLIGLLPFFHIYGMVVILNAALRKGSCVVVVPRFDPQQFLETLQKHKVTHAHVVPPIVLFLAKHPLVDKFDLSSLQEVFSGAAPLGKDLTEAAVTRLKLKNFRQGWGMTELSPAGLVTPSVGGEYGSAGALVLNQECKIVDVETKKVITEIGKEGEIWMRGPNVMKGYLNNKQATDDTIDKDGFLHTGDIGYVNKNGNFFIVDRLKELIKFKGFQVPPAELEAILMGHPKVGDCAVIGKPDLEAGELPKAYIVKKADDLTGEEIMAYIAERVAPYKKLKEVEFIDAIPKSASGKILRRILKDKEKERAKAAEAELVKK